MKIHTFLMFSLALLLDYPICSLEDQGFNLGQIKSDQLGILNPNLFVDIASTATEGGNVKLSRAKRNSSESGNNNSNNVEGLLANCQLTNLLLYQALQQQRSTFLPNLGLGGFLGNLGNLNQQIQPFPAAAINQNLLFPLAETLHTYVTTSTYLKTLTTTLVHTIPLLFGNKPSPTTITRTKTYEVETSQVLTLTSTIRASITQIVPTLASSPSMVIPTASPTPNQADMYQYVQNDESERPNILERRSESNLDEKSVSSAPANKHNHRDKYVIEPEQEPEEWEDFQPIAPIKKEIRRPSSQRPTILHPETTPTTSLPAAPKRRRKNRNKFNKNKRERKTTTEAPQPIQEEEEDIYGGNYGHQYGGSQFGRARTTPSEPSYDYANDYYGIGQDYGGSSYNPRYYTTRRRKRGESEDGGNAEGRQISPREFRPRRNLQASPEIEPLEPSFYDEMEFAGSNNNFQEKCPPIQEKVTTITVTETVTYRFMEPQVTPSSSSSLERSFRTRGRYLPGRHYSNLQRRNYNKE